MGVVREDVILTIGMIVKNEEKYLSRCIEGISPLLKAIPSELIIVDTGSRDETVEIAKTYTDKVYPFAWCDDFAAARNVTIQHATGSWYMQVDADEIFESVEGMISFFQSGLYKNYQSASYRMLNWMKGPEGEDYVEEHIATRLYRFRPGIAYVGKIHEYIPYSQPTYAIADIVNHYGYCYERPSEKHQKQIRNIRSLEEVLREQPENLPIRIQLIREWIQDDNLEKAWCLIQGEIPYLTEHSSHVFLGVYYEFRGWIGLQRAQYWDAISSAERTLELVDKGEMHGAIARYIKGRAWQALGAYSKAIEAYQSALQEESRMEGEASAAHRDRSVVVLFHRKEWEREVQFYLGACFLYWGKYKAAKTYLGISLKIEDEKENQDTLEGFLRFLKGCQKQELIREFQKQIITRIQEQKGARWIDEFILQKDSEFLEFLFLCKILAADAKNEINQILELAKVCTSKIEKWTILTEEVVSIFLKRGLDITPIFANISLAEIKTCVERVYTNLGDLEKNKVLEYLEQQEWTETLEALTWNLMLTYEGMKFQLKENQEVTESLALVERYAILCSLYCQNVYQAEVLEEAIEAIPLIQRCGLYLFLAIEQQDRDGIGALSYLKQALILESQLKAVVSYYQQQILTEMDKQTEAAGNLGDQLKEQTQLVFEEVDKRIQAEEYGMALDILATLEQILPQHKEIEKRRKKIQLSLKFDSE